MSSVPGVCCAVQPKRVAKIALNRLRLICCSLLWMVLTISTGYAQVPSLDATGVPTVARNSTSNLHAEGDSVWVGSFLNLTSDGGNSWFIADADSLFGSRNTVFSIEV